MTASSLSLRFFTPLLLGGLCGTWTAPAVRAQEKTVSLEMAAAAKTLLQQLPAAQKAQVHLSFADSERLRWSNEPESMHARKGLTVSEMDSSARSALQRLLRTVLSEQGYFKALNVMRLDGYLQGQGGGAVARSEGSGRYWLTIFGQPDAGNRWGWRFEGHHFSLNVTQAAAGIRCTPLFYGADPATFPQGPLTGWQNMFAETDRGWRLLQSFDHGQRTKAMVAPRIPEAKDILVRSGKEPLLGKFQGVAYTALHKAQQRQLAQLVAVYLQNIRPELAAYYSQQIQWSQLYFGWWGGDKAGAPVYYRIHGPGLVIEYCSRLGNPNHIHTLLRFLPADFGGGL